MVALAVAEVTNLLGARRVAGGAEGGLRMQGAAIDSRALNGGEAFFAFAGEHTDGHRFVPSALKSGAAVVVVENRWLRQNPESVDLWQQVAAEAAVLAVDDSLAALHALTAGVRRRVPRHLVGITGSAGKTTTKEVLAHLLGQRFRTEKSPGNLNNLLGFPLALLALPEDTEWMVAEMGMSEPGELGRLSRLARPDGVVLLNVGSAHLERFGTVAAVAEAKAEILEGLPVDGLLVSNADDPQLRRVTRRHRDGEFRGRFVTFGRRASDGSLPRLEEGEEARLLAAPVAAPVAAPIAASVAALAAGGASPRTPDVGTRFELQLVRRGEQGESVVAESAPVDLPLHGSYNVDNFLAASACAWALGVDLETLSAAAVGLESLAGRGRVLRLPGSVVVDDVYNSNPEAVQRALSSAAELAETLGCTRRWVVLGDMLELGEAAPRLHRESGAAAAAAGFQRLLAVGEHAHDLVAGAASAGLESRPFASTVDAAPVAAATLRPGDLVLVKGSRGVALDALVSALRRAAGGGDD
ncbi:MAG: Mur ligase family protein [Acidobacteriota bacterium]